MFNEVRKGNIVGYNLFTFIGTPFIIKEIKENRRLLLQSIYDQTLQEIHPDALMPIPLTARRMNKLLFTRINYKWTMNGCWVAQKDDHFEVTIGTAVALIRTVHEFQNFYFTQMGEELWLPFILPEPRAKKYGRR